MKSNNDLPGPTTEECIVGRVLRGQPLKMSDGKFIEKQIITLNIENPAPVSGIPPSIAWGL
jgi:hypothetical protein